MANNFVNSSTIGVDLNSTSTTAQFGLGTKVAGNDDSHWTYVYMSGAAVAGDLVAISATGTAAVSTIAFAVNPMKELAFAQVAFTAADFGWVCRGGKGMSVSMSATTAADTLLYVGTTAGKLSTTASSATLIGVQVVGASATATTWTASGTLSWPMIRNKMHSES